mmetsp:Transcript_15117/g.46686  ORF Transcript_15117/g.46686 Transcript_15117/m.46686 type:complete len:291 (+) Transcript_15117:3349-4221(+)
MRLRGRPGLSGHGRRRAQRALPGHGLPGPRGPNHRRRERTRPRRPGPGQVRLRARARLRPAARHAARLHAGPDGRDGLGVPRDRSVGRRERDLEFVERHGTGRRAGVRARRAAEPRLRDGRRDGPRRGLDRGARRKPRPGVRQPAPRRLGLLYERSQRPPLRRRADDRRRLRGRGGRRRRPALRRGELGRLCRRTSRLAGRGQRLAHRRLRGAPDVAASHDDLEPRGAPRGRARLEQLRALRRRHAALQRPIRRRLPRLRLRPEPQPGPDVLRRAPSAVGRRQGPARPDR